MGWHQGALLDRFPSFHVRISKHGGCSVHLAALSIRLCGLLPGTLVHVLQVTSTHPHGSAQPPITSEWPLICLPLPGTQPGPQEAAMSTAKAKSSWHLRHKGALYCLLCRVSITGLESVRLGFKSRLLFPFCLTLEKLFNLLSTSFLTQKSPLCHNVTMWFIQVMSMVCCMCAWHTVSAQ